MWNISYFFSLKGVVKELGRAKLQTANATLVNYRKSCLSRGVICYYLLIDNKGDRAFLSLPMIVSDEARCTCMYPGEYESRERSYPLIDEITE